MCPGNVVCKLSILYYFGLLAASLLGPVFGVIAPSWKRSGGWAPLASVFRV